MTETRQYSAAEVERMMKLQDVLLKAMAKKITWWDAAEIIGVSDRTMRRWRERIEEGWYAARSPIQIRAGQPWKRRDRGSRGKPQAGFPPLPPSLGNLANNARFPLSHRCGSGCPWSKEDEQTQIGKPKGIKRPHVLFRTDHVLIKADNLTCYRHGYRRHQYNLSLFPGRRTAP